jgi:hypothetical protein
MKLALALTALVLLSGCGNSAGSGAQDSGIRGRAVIASCGVPFTDAECQDPPPYEGKLNVRRTLEGPVIASIGTETDGRFRISLEPGTYFLEWKGAPFPILKPVPVTVREHEFTSVTLSLDSGIR